MYPPVIQKLIKLFSKFPTVGPRTAARFVFYLIKLPKEDFEKLIKALNDLKKDIKICSFCFNPFDASIKKVDLCPICQDRSRDKNIKDYILSWEEQFLI